MGMAFAITGQARERGRGMIYIIRHGQTDMNKARVLQGRSDYPLNAVGIAQAKRVGEAFQKQGIVFDAVFSSPLSRAFKTASLASLGKEVQADPRIMELYCGPYEGMDLNNLPPELEAFFADFIHVPAPRGMEPLEDIVKRVGNFLEDLKKEVQGKNVLIATHAIAMKGALEYLTPESKGAYWSKKVSNCEVYATELVEGNYLVPKPFLREN